MQAEPHQRGASEDDRGPEVQVNQIDKQQPLLKTVLSHYDISIHDPLHYIAGHRLQPLRDETQIAQYTWTWTRRSSSGSHQ